MSWDHQYMSWLAIGSLFLAWLAYRLGSHACTLGTYVWWGIRVSIALVGFCLAGTVVVVMVISDVVFNRGRLIHALNELSSFDDE